MILLITSLPTENATIRMRIWRTLKTSGAVVLRDGVYLIPNHASCREMFTTISNDVLSTNGMAYVISINESEVPKFINLFDRSIEYKALGQNIEKAYNKLSGDTVNDVLKETRKLRKALNHLVSIDFYPNTLQQTIDQKLQALELSIARVISPDEPHSIQRTISTLSITDFQHRTWATRQRPKIDRLASSWLIKRFIDMHAEFKWLKSINDIPSDAIGFDFDGATFSHIDNRVTFEVLVESFAFEQLALKRIGTIVHYLDVGGVAPPEAIGIESILQGMCETTLDDDQLLNNASTLFDALFLTFEKQSL
jgi:hypothetical protein